MTEKQGRVLVACPTYAGKEYALDAWVAGFREMEYEPRFAYQVDNTSQSEACFDRIKATGIEATHIVPWPDWDRTFLACWRLILERAQALDCYRQQRALPFPLIRTDASSGYLLPRSCGETAAKSIMP